LSKNNFSSSKSFAFCRYAPPPSAQASPKAQGSAKNVVFFEEACFLKTIAPIRFVLYACAFAFGAYALASPSAQGARGEDVK
jgi:hypothetical protein